jgi:lipoprotein-anchoring transpeptidase ErfK/SrfK
LNDSPGQTNGSRMRRAIIAVAVLAALIPLVPIAAGFALTSGGAGSGSAGSAAFNPLVHAPPVTHAPPAARQHSGLPPGRGVLVAVMLHRTTMRAGPGARPLAKLGTRTDFGSPEALWVVDRSPGWLGVVSPLAGNGQVGWIPQSAASLTRGRWELKVSLSARRLTVLEDGKTMQRYRVAVGRPDAPTPTGRFAVTDRLSTNDPSGPYGCCILALSAHSPHSIQGWSGGNRIAIHSTPDTESIGHPVSHGCMRLTLAEGRWLMNHVPLGTPTIISS